MKIVKKSSESQRDEGENQGQEEVLLPPSRVLLCLWNDMFVKELTQHDVDMTL